MTWLQAISLDLFRPWVLTPVGLFLIIFCVLALANPGFDVTEWRDALKLTNRIASGGGIGFQSDPGVSSPRARMGTTITRTRLETRFF
jgi:hypothetical protein